MKRKFRILVVDDDLNNIQVGINFLKQNESYSLVFATSGEQALERIKESRFDLVLLDIIMPTMDGFEVCRRLKSDPETRSIPIIFLTAKHNEESLMLGFELGGADYITKPFNAPELHARVKTHLELHYHYKKEIAKLHELLACSQRAETIKYIAGGIAHDCKNFMTSIPGNLFLLERLLLEKGLKVEDFKEFSHGMTKAMEKVSSLLDKLTDFSHRTAINCEVVDMNEVVYDLNKMFKGHLQHNISLSIEFLSQPAYAMADKLHIEQVLLNIMLNAQFAVMQRLESWVGEGSIHISIDKIDGCDHIALADETTYLDIAVTDNGIGMERDMVERIFTPYFSTRKEQGGTGLGLAVSMSIVQSYGGIIEVKSTPGKGSVFNIYFPYYVEDADSGQQKFVQQDKGKAGLEKYSAT